MHNKFLIAFAIIIVLVILGIFLDRYTTPVISTQKAIDVTTRTSIAQQSDSAAQPVVESNTDEEVSGGENENPSVDEEIQHPDSSATVLPASRREILQTDGLKHSIPLDEILSGGPPKDGIPSIDEPQFIDASEATFVTDDEIGLGIHYKGETRFYPYQILVWHELVNDTMAGDPLLVTYCPLCATGIVFERKVGGEAQEFGVSGRLWQSNLLMYNRTTDVADESLWSQVLGEAVVGPQTGTRLPVVPADTVRFGEWKSTYPDSKVLSRNTGALRSYGRDPYGDYYTNEHVSYGATFQDTRAHPKAFVLGIEINGTYKAYPKDLLPVGDTLDVVAETSIRINKNQIGEVVISRTRDNTTVPTVGSFWFSWLAVHPDSAIWSPTNN